MSCCTALTSSMVWMSLRLAVLWSIRSWNLCKVCSTHSKKRRESQSEPLQESEVMSLGSLNMCDSIQWTDSIDEQPGWWAFFSRSVWQGTRYSVIFWFKDSMASVKNDTTPWYDKMAQSSSAAWINFGRWWVRSEAVGIDNSTICTR